MAKIKDLHPTAVRRHRSYGDFWEIVVRYRDPDTGKSRTHPHITDIPYDGTAATRLAVISSQLALDTVQEVRDILAKKSPAAKPERITLSECLDMWLQYRDEVCCHMLNKIALTTVRENRTDINLIKKYFDKNPVLIDRLNDRHLLQYMHYLKDKGKTNKYIIKKFGVISQCLKYAIREQYITINPMINVDLPRAERHKERTFLTIEQLGLLLERAKGEEIETLINILIYLGVRMGEACALTWDCVDFERKTVKIEKQDISLPGLRYSDRLKTENSYCMLHMPAGLEEYLKELKAQQEHDKIYCGNAYKEPKCDVIMRKWNGSALSKGHWRTKFREFIEKQNDIPYITPHCLRHSFNVAQQEMDISALIRARTMRDTVKTVEKHYDHVRDKKINEAMDKYATMLTASYS